MSSIWVLTREINAYEQEGEYFAGIYSRKPDISLLSIETGITDEEYLTHILKGGGRVGSENEWWFLKEYYFL
ncbi:hypothetical protein PQC38_gp080 [Aeromonas phage BUCT695]|uniref:hypothetical protein n=1 Tax=Aeromonas phage BUCT695 TaxID=2908630 RepID=UPI002329120F|nr:hypothetical protein PQC38_gp080 [Aeromonas phage BUCT695]UIW10556.1 hypothetical protein [Aeromonas phage BUCT695]